MEVIAAVITILILAGLASWLWRKTADSWELKRVFWPALVFRLLCGILLGYFYSKLITNGGDTWLYQKTSNSLTAIGKVDFREYLDILFFNKFADPEIIEALPYPTYTNSFFFVKIVSLLNFITYNNYYLNSLVISFFSFAGCWYLVLKIGKVFHASRKAAVIAFLFFPSVVFWNSGIMKDGILLSALGFFWGAALQLAYFPEKGKLKPILVLLLSAILLWKIKFFVAAFVFALTGSWFSLTWLYRRFVFFRQGYLRWLAIPVVILIMAFIFSLLHYKFNLPFLLMSLVLNYQLFREKSVGKPIIELENLEPTLSSVIFHIPEALPGILFRPFLWEGDSVFYRLAGLENLVLLCLLLGALAGWRKLNLKQLPGFYLMLLVFCLCLAVAFALSTPNLGSLNRYRTAFLPFLVFLLLQTHFWKQLLSRVSSKLKRAMA